MPPPARPKLYHIVHVDRLASVVTDGALWCDAKVQRRKSLGTTIGMTDIKKRRLSNVLDCWPDLAVGDCVPFYFCPRSVMLFVIHKANHQELTYHGGQGPIVHLEADLHETVEWADQSGYRWAFTLSNAGSSYFQDRCDLAQLPEIDWKAVKAGDRRGLKEQKQAEFLVESSFPWSLVQRVGVHSAKVRRQVQSAMCTAAHQPTVEIKPNWCY